MPLGPVMLDVAGTELMPEDIARLRHPLVGGVILFTRNYSSPRQLAELTHAIRALRDPPLLIAVDHEGGRVQRFREGFTRIPPMRELGRVWGRQPGRARQLAQQAGWVLGAELRACGVDFSFTPVLDLDYGTSEVIGDRAFHRDPDAVATLAHALTLGLKHAGMQAVGKHFPGHGYAGADSHVEVPVDNRAYADLRVADLVPFKRLIDLGLAAVMPAHVVFPRVDRQPAGFSRVWLKDVLRGELGFDGCIFSDDLCMEGASAAGGIVERAQAAFAAGCDVAVLCNRPEAADELLAGLAWEMPAVSRARLARMHGRAQPEPLSKLHGDPQFVKAVHEVGSLGISEGELPLPPGSSNSCGKR